MRGYISGTADNSRINYCPLCRAVLRTNAYYGDGTVVCDECDFHFAVIECEEKEHDEELQNHELTSANGYPIIKQNQSVKDLVAVEKQMLQLLKEMGLTTDEPTGNEMIDEDL